MRPGGLTIGAGGEPDGHQIAAVAAAISSLLDEERAAVAADPLPAAYRSRWRRAALMETTEVPVNVKDLGPPWGGW